jgi:hypothetical protein
MSFIKDNMIIFVSYKGCYFDRRTDYVIPHF